jgi:hypothetical protein
MDDAATGFDYTYDKRLYDRLRGHARPVRDIPRAGLPKQNGADK